MCVCMGVGMHLVWFWFGWLVWFWLSSSETVMVGMHLGMLVPSSNCIHSFQVQAQYTTHIHMRITFQ
jgi:hypothetical protein